MAWAGFAIMKSLASSVAFTTILATLLTYVLLICWTTVLSALSASCASGPSAPGRPSMLPANISRILPRRKLISMRSVREILPATVGFQIAPSTTACALLATLRAFSPTALSFLLAQAVVLSSHSGRLPDGSFMFTGLLAAYVYRPPPASPAGSQLVQRPSQEA